MPAWNRAVEMLPRAQLEALQLKGLRKTLRRLSARDLLSLDDLAGLPFMTAADLRGRTLQARCSVDRRELAEFHFDPATGLSLAATKGDLRQTAEAWARAFAAAGLEPGQACAILEPLALSGDGLACYQGCRKFGLCCVPAGESEPTRQAELLVACHIKAVFATVASLLRVPVRGLESGLFRAVFAPAAELTPGLRAELEGRFACPVFAIDGRPETGGAGTVGYACTFQDGLHVCADQYVIEIVDPKTGEVVPDGEPGELVLTTLAREAQPLLRYRTGETACIVSREPCQCGRTTVRYKPCRPA